MTATAKNSEENNASSWESTAHGELEEPDPFADLPPASIHAVFVKARDAFLNHGGLDAVDSVLAEANQKLAIKGYRYVLGPGAVCEIGNDGHSASLGIPYFDTQNRQIVSVQWISLPEGS